MPLTIAASNETPKRLRGRPRKVKLRHLTADGRLKPYSPSKAPKTQVEGNSFAAQLSRLPLSRDRLLPLFEAYHAELLIAAEIARLTIAYMKKHRGSPAGSPATGVGSAARAATAVLRSVSGSASTAARAVSR